jgi:hypothetical protein
VIGSGKTEARQSCSSKNAAIATSATIVKTDRELHPIKRQGVGWLRKTAKKLPYNR